VTKHSFSYAIIQISILLLGGVSSTMAQYGTSAMDSQISHALLPLPEAMRERAMVLGYDDDGKLVTLREGESSLVCVADKPGDERYSGVCYHESLGPFISRGRELRADGVEGVDVLAQRHEEMDAGMLELPTQGAVLYNMTMDAEDFDPETAVPLLYAIYTPYATVESTGIPNTPPGPGGPWIMRAGTPSSHIMIVLPQADEEEED
jgi:hypothetical protein